MLIGERPIHMDRGERGSFSETKGHPCVTTDPNQAYSWIACVSIFMRDEKSDKYDANTGKGEGA